MFFDQIAASEKIILEPVRCYGYVLERLGQAPGGLLADIGCGTGEMLFRILRETGDRFTLSGVDLSANSLEKAAEKCGASVSLKKGDVERLPYGSATQDILLCMHSFHHYPHPLRALREMIRVLKPGGKLILVENRYPFLRREMINLDLMLRAHPQGDFRMYSRRQLAFLVRMAGFRLSDYEAIAEHSQLLECVKRGKR